MLGHFYIFVIKLVFGTTLGLIGAYYTRKKKKKMRIYDTLGATEQQGILYTCVSYAKGEIQELNLPPETDVVELAVQYDTMYFLTVNDFLGFDTGAVPAFVGGRPVKRP